MHCSGLQTSSFCHLLALTRALFSFPGGYDGNDVEFSWLRGNDSVRGLENLRLAQYTIQRYFTLVTRSRQETGDSWDTSYKSKITEFHSESEIPYLFHFISLAPRNPLHSVAGQEDLALTLLPISRPVLKSPPKGSESSEVDIEETSRYNSAGILGQSKAQEKDQGSGYQHPSTSHSMQQQFLPLKL